MIILSKDDLIKDFEIEPNTLVNDDCLNAMKFIPDNSISLILADPPYGTSACKWDSIIPFEPMWEELHRITKDNGAIVLFGSEPFSSALRMSNIKNYKYDWIWLKNKRTNFLNANKQPLRTYEGIHVFYGGQCTYKPQKSKGHKPVNKFTKKTSDGNTMGKTKLNISGGGNTDRYPINVLKFNVVNQDGNGKEKNYHPTQKPVDLLEYLIKTYTNEGETVLDFTAGSGSTGVACVNTDRSFIGIEMDDSYFEVAQSRINGVQ